MNNINKLSVFDFDNTLVKSPEPDFGKKFYKFKTGEDWPHVGWWSQPDSLNARIFDIPIISKTLSIYHKEKSDPNALVVMLTGRIQKLSKYVENILSHYNLKFDKYFYNTGGETLLFKINVLDNLLKQYPHVDSVLLNDDRLEHIPAFEAWGNNHLKSGLLKDFDINVIQQ